MFNFSLLHHSTVMANVLRWIPLILFSTAVLALDAIKRGKSDPIFSAWYAGWHAKDYPLSDVSWSKYTHMIYSAA